MRSKRAFELKQKVFSIIFKRLSVAKNDLRPESVPFNVTSVMKHIYTPVVILQKYLQSRNWLVYCSKCFFQSLSFNCCKLRI